MLMVWQAKSHQRARQEKEVLGQAQEGQASLRPWESAPHAGAIHTHKLLADAKSLYLKGRRAAKLEQWDLAIDAYDAAIGIQPDFTDAYFSRGAAKQRQAFAYIRENNEREALRMSRGATQDKRHALELADCHDWYMMDNAQMEPYERMTRKAIELDARINRTDEAALRSLRKALQQQEEDASSESLPAGDGS